MPQLPTGTVTFLFTDIEGSTRLLSEAADAYRTLLEDHRRLIREAVVRHGGVIFGTEGDAVFLPPSIALWLPWPPRPTPSAHYVTTGGLPIARSACALVCTPAR